MNATIKEIEFGKVEVRVEDRTFCGRPQDLKRLAEKSGDWRFRKVLEILNKRGIKQ